MKTFIAKPSTIKHDWFVVDAADKTLGRLATEVARRLRGKHKADFTPTIDTGDYVVVVNAAKVRVSGKKVTDKMYYRHSGYTGNLKELRFEELHARHPERIIELAVRGMMPKGPLGRAMLRKLRVYAGEAHQHQAQQPKALTI